MNGPKATPQTGVYYSPQDLAGVARRMLVVGVDLFVVLLTWILVSLLVWDLPGRIGLTVRPGVPGGATALG